MSQATLSRTLNDAQMSAVMSNAAVVRVIAGAGTGKTSVLLERIKRRLLEGCDPSAIIAVTFTNKAAEEMRERLSADMPEVAGEIRFSTFHGLCIHLLRTFLDLSPFKSRSFTILDEEDQLKLIEGVLDDEAAKHDVSFSKSHRQSEALSLQQRLNRLRQTGIDPACEHEHSDSSLLYFHRRYDEALIAANAIDFAGLVLRATRLMRRDYAEIRSFRASIAEILVDEFQDTDPAQLAFLRALRGENTHLFIVGDGDQSLYSWRGASPEQFRDIADTFDDVETIQLSTNYRSTDEILSAANGIVARNPRPTPKVLVAGKAGPTPTLTRYNTDLEEAEAIARMIAAQIAGASDTTIAVITRAATHLAPVSAALSRLGVAHASAGGRRLTEAPEVRDAIALIRCLINDHDGPAAIRLTGRPLFIEGIGSDRSLSDAIAARGILATLQALGGSTNIPASSRVLINRLSGAIGWGRDALVRMSLSEVLDGCLEAIDYIAAWRAIPGENWEQRQRTLRRFREDLDSLVPDPTLFGHDDAGDYTSALIQSLACLGRADEEASQVLLTTCHSAKGLEFDTVFCPAFEEQHIPSAGSVNDPRAMIEERNIAHVMFTRARQALFISCAKTRRGRVTNASRFLTDSGLRFDDMIEHARSRPRRAAAGGAISVASTRTRRPRTRPASHGT